MKIFWQTAALLSFFVFGSVVAYAHNKGNSGNPVPHLQDDSSSADFIANSLAADSGVDAKHFERFARKLVKSLSQLTAAQQDEVFYGS